MPPRRRQRRGKSLSGAEEEGLEAKRSATCFEKPGQNQGARMSAETVGGREQGGGGDAGRPAGEIFSESDLRILDCAICSKPLVPPIFQCKVGHVLCSVCCGKRSSNLCPTCFQAVGFNRCFAFEQIAGAVKVPCSNFNLGCDKYITYYQKEKHEKTCMHAPCFCPEDGCSFVGSTASLLNHFVTEHKWSPKNFNYEEPQRISIPRYCRFVLLVGEDQSLFLVVNTFAHIGNVLTTVCIRPHESGSCYSSKISAVHRAQANKGRYVVRTLPGERAAAGRGKARPQRRAGGGVCAWRRRTRLLRCAGTGLPAADKEKEEAARKAMDPDPFECPICLSRFQGSIFQCKNGHAVCEACHARIHGTCPSCREPVGNIRCRALENAIAGMTLPCSFRSYGCTQLLKHAERPYHEAFHCRHAPFGCPVRGCPYSGLLLYDHVMDAHSLDYDDSLLGSCWVSSLHRSTPFEVLLDPVDRRVFLLLNGGDVRSGRSLSVVCLGPSPAANKSLKYKLEVGGAGKPVSCMHSWAGQYPDRFLFVPDAYWTSSGSVDVNVHVHAVEDGSSTSNVQRLHALLKPFNLLLLGLAFVFAAIGMVFSPK